MNKKSKRFINKNFNMVGKPLSLDELHQIHLHMMIEFDNFCSKNNLRYFLCGGTLLGAVRHSGFIPWDDDVDILMPRPDYERFIQFSKISEKSQIVTYKNDQGYYHPFAYCNVADTETIMVEKGMKYPTGKGVFLDIFPLDGVPEDSGERKRFLHKLLLLRYIKGIPTFPVRRIKKIKDLIFNLSKLVLKNFDEMKAVDKINRIAQKYKYEESKHVGQLMVVSPWDVIWPSKDYEGYTMLSFEGHNFRVPTGYKRVLVKQYGDYMKLPPESERGNQHGIDYMRRKQSVK